MAGRQIGIAVPIEIGAANCIGAVTPQFIKTAVKLPPLSGRNRLRGRWGDSYTTGVSAAGRRSRRRRP